ncbi:3'-5' exonuclease [Nitrincola schmidtii]|uniref:3'-5' exonuclease n=1 Tax=Nitrincola schmidtii TaxID=1730894 RepID=UPI00124C1A1F|nr:exonuclease domain-containing protein [Nitrincola schmidtii]
MPKRQFLLGIWMLATGLVTFAGLIFGALLDGKLSDDPQSRTILWILVAILPTLLLIAGVWLERKLFAPLRHLQIQFARLAANPDAKDDFLPEGWLSNLGQDFSRLREGWRQDREKLNSAREAGAQDAARIRHELEAVLEVLEVPLLLCDRHQRVLMLNPAAKAFFSNHPALGLGRHLGQLLPLPNLAETLKKLPTDGSPRQVLLHHEDRWLRCDLRRVSATQGEALITLSDTTEAHASHQRWRQPLANLLPQLRGHTASLTTTAEALSGAPQQSDIRPRLEKAMHEESQVMGDLIDQLSRVLESIQLDQTCLTDTWSGDLTAALTDICESSEIDVVPIGIPAWFRADSPTLLVMLEVLLPALRQACKRTSFEIEFCLGNKRVYLDIVWLGVPISQHQLDSWRTLPLSEQPLAPRISDVLSQHNSDWWCLPDHDREHSRLRIPLPATDRYAEPERQYTSRPEFHDFSIAELPPPDAELGNQLLSQLEMVVFDTETTGLKLRDGDRVISIGACRILNGRLLANEHFDQLVNPERDIPAESTAIHGIHEQDVKQSPPMRVVLPRFRHFVGQAVLVAHNAAFDILALDLPAKDAGLQFDMPVLDTLLLSRAIDPDLETHGLDALSDRFQITFPAGTRHTALGDARVTAELLLNLIPRLEARGITTLQQALDFQATAETVRVG